MRKLLVLGLLAGFAGAALGQTTATVSVSADVVGGGASQITVSPATIDFGMLSPSAGDHRFKTSALTGEFFAATAPWRITVYTTNDNGVVGMVSPGGADIMPQFKFNQANFGSDDEDNDENWASAINATFKGIFDVNTIDTNTMAVFRSTLARSDEGDTSPIEFKFAIDAGGVVATNYSADVVFELEID